MAKQQTTIDVPESGACDLAAVHVDAYNAELRENGAFLGDRANKGAFLAQLEEWRKHVRGNDRDPAHDPLPAAKLKDRRQLEQVLLRGDPHAAGVLLGAIEDFAQDLSQVVRRLLRTKHWRGTERIAVGGGFRRGRIGELAIGRTAVLLRAENSGVDLVPIKHKPDHAGLVGGIHLVAAKRLARYDGLLAADIGGTNIRAGTVSLPRDLGEADVLRLKRWRHADERPGREEAIERLIGMFRRLVIHAQRDGLRLAPFIAIACPGIVRPDGSIRRGGQNLPGDWEDENFNIVERLRIAIPEIGGRPTAVVVHNDAVVQGLSQVPFMHDVHRWGILTIGTGLGNARFSNRTPP